MWEGNAYFRARTEHLSGVLRAGCWFVELVEYGDARFGTGCVRAMLQQTSRLERRVLRTRQQMGQHECNAPTTACTYQKAHGQS
jgi:hypothetical protein